MLLISYKLCVNYKQFVNSYTIVPTFTFLWFKLLYDCELFWDPITCFLNDMGYFQFSVADLFLIWIQRMVNISYIHYYVF